MKRYALTAALALVAAPAASAAAELHSSCRNIKDKQDVNTCYLQEIDKGFRSIGTAINKINAKVSRKSAEAFAQDRATLKTHPACVDMTRRLYEPSELMDDTFPGDKPLSAEGRRAAADFFQSVADCNIAAASVYEKHRDYRGLATICRELARKEEAIARAIAP